MAALEAEIEETESRLRLLLSDPRVRPRVAPPFCMSAAALAKYSKPPDKADMGINYSIDAEARIVRLEYVGETNIEELTATLRAIFRSPNYRPGFGFLADRRNANAPTLDSAEHVVAFMVLHRAKVVGGRWALVVGSPASYGMGRMGQTIAEGGPMRVKVFQHIEDAERWLRETAPAA